MAMIETHALLNDQGLELGQERFGRSTSNPSWDSGLGLGQIFDLPRLLSNSKEVVKYISMGMVQDPWVELEGAYVLRPLGKPIGVAHFIGGAFVGASPQITYRAFLKTLANGGLLIIVTPYVSRFDHMRIADELLFTFDQAYAKLGQEVEGLPVYGIGHSLGAWLHLLIGSRFNIERAGNVLISVNGKSLADIVPLFQPVVAPITEGLGPLLASITNSSIYKESDPFNRLLSVGGGAGLDSDALGIVKQVIPLLNQAAEVASDVARGNRAPTPSRQDAKRIITQYYGIDRNLLLAFGNDTVDETSDITVWLSAASKLSDTLDVTLLRRPGTHIRPLQQPIPDVPPNVAFAGKQGNELLGALASFAGPLGAKGTPLGNLASSLDSLTTSTSTSKRAIEADLNKLADDILKWISSYSPIFQPAVEEEPFAKPDVIRALPPPSSPRNSTQQQPNKKLPPGL
eukprot:CAMPEP_0198201092 /NCGR_PEP_ID=MMETSP1445-20131203/3900_1 /TAXON_ID=36898 /ORGANISM="Pyramimonas sp., Strain CCMP2087" /LENGTH=457 /DNA_ID=CAMNT_0043871285 /DNA_START=601 /DNA_END=1973 /DNA_ORIENTATION=+